MATIIQDYNNSVTGIAGDVSKEVLSVVKGDILQLEVVYLQGVQDTNVVEVQDTNAVEIEIKAQVVGKAGKWYPIAVIADENYRLSNKIQTSGLYKIDVVGFSQIEIAITFNTNCTVMYTGRVVTNNG